MLGKLFECEADKNKKYYRVIQTLELYILDMMIMGI